nr:aminotransferase-like mobile domain-containing protein [Tanacetum cinerariifolium]
MGTIPETFPPKVLAGYNQYKILFKQENIPPFEYALQFSAIFKLPWILSWTHKKQEAEGSSPPLLLRQFSAKWWKQITENQADKEASAHGAGYVDPEHGYGYICYNEVCTIDDNGILSLSVCIIKDDLGLHDRDAHKVLKVVLNEPNILDCSICLEPLWTPVFQC